MKKRKFLWLCVLFAFLLSLSALAAGEGEAQKLHDLGLLAGKGTNPDGSIDYALDGTLSRAESITQVVRFLGKEAAATSETNAHPFTDLPAWAVPYVSYAYANGVTKGVSETKFDSDGKMTDAAFLTAILRVLGYDDGAGDFVWSAPYALAKSVGLVGTETPTAAFTRGDAFVICWNALTAKPKTGGTVADRLLKAGVFDEKTWNAANTERVQLPASATDPQSYYVSPFTSVTQIGDPFILWDAPSQKYYMYCSNGHCGCWSSPTGKNWTYEGDAYKVTDKSFGAEHFWAPEVYFRDNAYYMVYSAMTAEGRHSIGIAGSDDPKGPFTDLSSQPLFAPDYSVIDANLLFDGREIYLYFSKDCSENTVDGKPTSQIWGVQVRSDLSGTVGEPVLLTTPDAPWERKSGNTLWNEGPYVCKRDGVYYLLYSANYYASVNYAVGYATANDPLGPFVKAKDNPILIGDGQRTSGTGHCALFPSPDGTETYIAYHSLQNPQNPSSGSRIPCMDKLVFGKDGSLSVNGPATVLQPLPSGTAGIRKLLSGVTVTSTYPDVLGGTPVLTDERVAFTGTGAQDLYRFKVTADGCIELTLEDPRPLSAIWVYGIRYTALSPKTVYAVVNDTYVTAVKTFAATSPLAPAVLPLAGIPADVRLENIKLYFTAVETADEMAAISEILLTYKD